LVTQPSGASIVLAEIIALKTGRIVRYGLLELQTLKNGGRVFGESRDGFTLFVGERIGGIGLETQRSAGSRLGIRELGLR
jgi:hypothetical protein